MDTDSNREVSSPQHPVFVLQIKDLNSGTFGFVQLARDKQTGELIACKFIERGDKVHYIAVYFWFSPLCAVAEYVAAHMV